MKPIEFASTLAEDKGVVQWFTRNGLKSIFVERPFYTPDKVNVIRESTECRLGNSDSRNPVTATT